MRGGHPVSGRPEMVAGPAPLRSGLRSPAGLGPGPSGLRPPLSPGDALGGPVGPVRAPPLGLALSARDALGAGGQALRAVVKIARGPGLRPFGRNRGI
jgi:hypothetical protein